MLCFLNGKFVSEASPALPLTDRGFLYGDGLFETLRVYGGKPFAWKPHLTRMECGATFLKIKMPLAATELKRFAQQLIRKNEKPDSVLRIQLTRGPGIRGYSITGADQPTLLMTLHPLPPNGKSPLRWKLATSSFRVLAEDPLAAFKTSSKLLSIVARTEAEAAGADEALLLNHRDELAETTSCNLFWIQKDVVCTPPLQAGILPGITREFIRTICQKYKVPFAERTAGQTELRQADGVFLTSSVLEIVEAIALDQQPLARSPLPAKLWRAYQKLVK